LLIYSMKQKGLGKSYLSHISKNRLDGLLIANSEFDDSEILNLKKANKPFVLVNRFMTGINQYVVLNDKFGGKLATKHIIDFGHRRIAHISGPLFTSTGLARFQGYREGLKEAKINFNSNYMQESQYTIESGYQSMKNILDLPTPPSAVFASNIM